MKSVDVDWKEFYYTNGPLVSPSNNDQEIGWVKEEFKKIDIAYKFLRSTTENDWYSHFVHNLDNLMRYGGCNPAIHVQADVRRTRLIGTTHVYEGGCMLVRSREDIYRMKDLKGKKIGLTKSLNVIKNDWWRIQEEYVFLGHEAMAVNIPVAFPKYIYDANKRKYSFEINPDFIDHVEELFNPDGMIVSMCRSGGRSAFAINMLAKAGFTNIYKIIDGYEGDMVDDPESVVHGKRMKNGWSNSSPWNYDLDHAKVWIPTGEELE